MTSSPMPLPTALILARWVRYLPFRSQGIVEGAEFLTPSLRGASEMKSNRCDRQRSADQVLYAGRASCQLPAISFPDCAVDGCDSHCL